jgi:hypothetical protein
MESLLLEIEMFVPEGPKAAKLYTKVVLAGKEFGSPRQPNLRIRLRLALLLLPQRLHRAQRGKLTK